MLFTAVAFVLTQLPVTLEANVDKTPVAVGSITIVTQLPDAGTLFTLDHPATGRELWVAQANGARFLRDICPGPRSTAFGPFVTFGNRVYFTANDCRFGQELWSTDGTTDGTVMVADTVPGPGSGAVGLAATNSSLIYFSPGASPALTVSRGAAPVASWPLRTPDGGPLPVDSLRLLNANEIIFSSGGDFWRSDGGAPNRFATAPQPLTEWAVGGSQLMTVSSPQASPCGTGLGSLADPLLWTANVAENPPTFRRMAFDGGFVGHAFCDYTNFMFPMIRPYPHSVTTNAVVGSRVYLAVHRAITEPEATTDNVYRLVSLGAGPTAGPLLTVESASLELPDFAAFTPGYGNAALVNDRFVTSYYLGGSTPRPTGVTSYNFGGQMIGSGRGLIMQGGNGTPTLLKLVQTDAGTVQLGTSPSYFGWALGPPTRADVLGFGFQANTDAGVLTGVEPWWTNGTPAGTYALANLCADETSTAPASLLVAGDDLYFTGLTRQPSYQRELVRLTGADAGRVFDGWGFNPSDPKAVAVLDGGLFLTALDAYMHRVLYRLDLLDGGAPRVPGGRLAWKSGEDLLYSTDSTGAFDVVWVDSAGSQRQRTQVPAEPTSVVTAEGTVLALAGGNVYELSGSTATPRLSHVTELLRNDEHAIALTFDGGTAEVHQSSTSATFTRAAGLGASTAAKAASSPVATARAAWVMFRPTDVDCELRKVDLDTGTVTPIAGGWQALDCDAPLSRIGSEIWLSGWTLDAGMEPWRVRPNGVTTQLNDTVPGMLGAGISEFVRRGQRVVFPASNALGDVELSSVTLPDSTPPLVLPVVSGDAGSNGWFVSDVSVTFTATDVDSDVVILSGCRPQTLTTDTPSSTFSCTAESLGGIQTATATVKRDATPPTIACPPLVRVDATSDAGAVVSYAGPDAGDALSAVQITVTPPSGSSFPIGGTDVQMRATDEAGNSASCVTRVIVADAPPSLTCPGTLTQEAMSAQGAVIVTPVATVNDVVAGALVATLVDGGVDQRDGGLLVALGHTELLFVATDGTVTVSCTTAVDVVDHTAPVLQCPDIDVTTPDDAGTPVDFTMTQVVEAVSPAAATFQPTAGSQFAIGDTTVSGTATDEAGNVGTCTFVVHVTKCTDCNKTVTPRSLYRWSCGGCAAGPGPLLFAVALMLLRRRRAR